MSLVPDATWHGLRALCAALAAANAAAWGSQQMQAPAAVTAVTAAVAAAAAGLLAQQAGRRSRAGGVGVLTWDGAQWQWLPTAAAPRNGEARVMLDLGAWLLLRFVSPAAPALWLVATRRMAGPSWPAWRAALFARRPRREPLSARDDA